MIVIRTRVPRSRRATPSAVSRRVSLLLALLLTLAGIPASGVRAQSDGADVAVEPLLTPIADVLSASSWLWAAGLDPRHPDSGALPTGWSATSSASAPDRASRNVIVTHQVGAVPVSSEPSLAVDPDDPDRLVLAVSALDLPSVATYASVDGGESWEGPRQAPYFARDVASAGAPGLAFDQDGNVYLVSRSLGFEEVRVGARTVTVERSRIVVSRSDDGGRSWGAPAPVVSAAIDAAVAPDETGQMTGGLAFDVLDSPAIAIGPDPGRPERQIVTIAYTELRTRFTATDAAGLPVLSAPAVETTIRLVQSADGGQTWSDPVAVSPTALRSTGGLALPASEATGATVAEQPAAPPVEPAPGPPADASDGGDQVVQGPAVGVLGDGTIVVAYLDSTRDGPQQGLATIMVAVSEDGGRTFSDPVRAGLFREIGLQPRTAFFRWWDAAFPRLAIGPEEEIAIAVTARPDARAADDGDILLFRSFDQGERWEAPVQVGSVNEASQFFPAITFAADGTLHAIWGELFGDPAGAGYAVVSARSRDQGATWEAAAPDGTAQLSETPANALLGYPGGRYLGGRLALAASGEAVYAAWPDTRLASAGSPWQQVAFSTGP